MKRCLKCGRFYADADLNFCLDDGELLVRDYPDETAGGLFDEPPTAIYAEPPTVLSDPARKTNPAMWPNPVRQQTSPIYSAPVHPTGIELQRRPDQTIAVTAMVLGILSLVFTCCYGGFWLGLPAVFFGFWGMRRADSDPGNYGGKSLAIAGVFLGVISFLISVGLIIAGVLAR